MGIFDGIGNTLKSINPLKWGDESESQIQQRDQLTGQGAAAGRFADDASANYTALGNRGYEALDALQAQARGENSVSAEQMRQSLQQMFAQQRAAAAGASPQNAAAAARTAAIQTGRLGMGMAGQQAIAGMQERNQAQQAYGSLLGQMRGQDLQGSIGGRQTAIGAYGGYKPEGSTIEKFGPAAVGGLSAAAMSDERAKKKIRDGDAAASAAARGLGSYLFRYRDAANGRGEQLGTMAQDLERNGLKHAVIDTPRGKMVDGAKLATTNTAMLGAMARRLDALEGKASAATPSSVRQTAALGEQLRRAAALAERSREDAAIRRLRAPGGRPPVGALDVRPDQGWGNQVGADTGGE